MAPGKAISFEQYAEQKGLRVHGKCQVCALSPEVREQVHKAWALDFRGATISRFLSDSGYPGFAEYGIRNHFARGHHERP